ncbi:MAG: SRPBCC family protein [Chloroflexota bacterium]
MSSHSQPIAKVTGSLRRMDDRAGAIRVECEYDTTVEDLWEAITRPDRLSRWIATVTGELRVGGEVQARFTSTWEGPGRIEVCEAPKHLLLTMASGTSEETVIEATIGATGAGARLVVEERGLPLGEIAAHGAGWQVHLEDLGSYIAGRQLGEWRSRWIELSPHYQQLGVETA